MLPKKATLPKFVAFILGQKSLICFTVPQLKHAGARYNAIWAAGPRGICAFRRFTTWQGSRLARYNPRPNSTLSSFDGTHNRKGKGRVQPPETAGAKNPGGR